MHPFNPLVSHNAGGIVFLALWHGCVSGRLSRSKEDVGLVQLRI
jgi:hypothetical protein